MEEIVIVMCVCMCEMNEKHLPLKLIYGKKKNNQIYNTKHKFKIYLFQLFKDNEKYYE